jgi:fatty-acid desaturase
MIIEFLIAFIVFYAWHATGVTIGYHRLLSHRSFKCAKIVEYFSILGGYLALQGSPIWWATLHRAHHRYVDQPRDPHAPRYGWLNAYYGWMFHTRYPDYINPAAEAKDLIKDQTYQFLEQGGHWERAHALAVFFNITFRVILLLCFGWTIALASLAAGFFVWQMPLLLNVVCHIPKLGYKNYETGDDSVNVWWVALLTAGEGWHNNHHAFPGSARSGLRRFEIDLSWLTLRLLKFIGLISWMREESILSNYKPDIQKAVSSVTR